MSVSCFALPNSTQLVRPRYCAPVSPPTHLCTVLEKAPEKRLASSVWVDQAHGRKTRPCLRRQCGRFNHIAAEVEDAIRLGAHEVVISTNTDEMAKHAGSFDFILDTVSAEQHDINQ